MRLGCDTFGFRAQFSTAQNRNPDVFAHLNFTPFQMPDSIACVNHAKT
jgi:hypothetical protein